MDIQEFVDKIIEDCINELYGSHNTKNLTALARKQHKEDSEAYKKIDPEHQSKEEVQKGLQNCTTEFKTRMYAEKNRIPLNCNFRDKLRYIQEFVGGAFMDVQPIQVVGKDHPAKENIKKEKEKKNKCQEQ